MVYGDKNEGFHIFIERNKDDACELSSFVKTVKILIKTFIAVE